MKKSAIIFALATSISGITAIRAQDTGDDARRTAQEQEVYEKTILPNPPRPATSPEIDPRINPAEVTAPAVNWKPSPAGPEREEIAPVNTVPVTAVSHPDQLGQTQPMPDDAGVPDDRRRMNMTRSQTLPAPPVSVKSHRESKGSPEQPEGIKPR